MKIAIWHLGSNGGGPQIQANISEAISRVSDVEVFNIFLAKSESRNSLMELPSKFLVLGKQTDSNIVTLIKNLHHTIKIIKFAKQNKIRCFYDVMDHPFQTFPRIVLRINRIFIIGSIHDLDRHLGEKNIFLDILTSIVWKCSSKIITYSSSVEAAAAKRFPKKSSKIEMVEHPAFGILRTRSKEHPNIKSKTVVIGFFGRIEEYKGLDRLVQACEILISKGMNIELRVIGRGQISPETKKSIHEMGAQLENIWVSVEKVQESIECFDILALPYTEASQSGVIGIAMNSGIPTVVTPIEGLIAPIEASKGGIIAKDFSAEAFAEALEKLVSSEILYSKLSKNSITYAQNNLGWDLAASKIIKISQDLLL